MRKTGSKREKLQKDGGERDGEGGKVKEGKKQNENIFFFFAYHLW